MYKILTIVFTASFILFFPLLNAYAYDHVYTVSGEDEAGNSVQGVLYFNNGESSITGRIIDENGRTHQFSGQWVGPGHVWTYSE